MTISLRCSTCQAELRVREDYLDRQIACPRCSFLVHVHRPVPSFSSPIAASPAEVPPPKKVYLACPRCGTPDPQRVLWTFWGSIYGPALFHHVACRKCGTTYNGQTGRSNLPVIICFTVIPLLGILFIGWVLGRMLLAR
jgi:DNA-directed RNA polymerase subunit RPC12/RpoP